jgi:hypothetical protein
VTRSEQAVITAARNLVRDLDRYEASKFETVIRLRLLMSAVWKLEKARDRSKKSR